MAADRVRDPIPRRWRFPLLGVAIAFIAPLGWFILQIPHQGLWSWPEVKVELANHALLYGYMTLGSGLCFAIAGYLLGRAFDAIVREQREAAAQATLMEGLNLRLEAISVTDELTGMYNRRYFFERLAEYLRAARRHRLPLSLMMIDIDHFKRINDAYGHATGDSVLREVAQALRATTRREDSVCRVGGEEFLVVCPDTDLKATLHFADRLRGAVQSLRIETGRGIERITISVGVAGREADMTGMEALVAAADKALYAAKHAGRNRTCLSAKGKVLCGNS